MPNCNTFALHRSRLEHNSLKHPELCIVELAGDGHLLIIKKALSERLGGLFDCPLCESYSSNEQLGMQKHFDRSHKKATLEGIPDSRYLTNSQILQAERFFPAESCKEELKRTTMLASVGLVFNTRYRLLICDICEHALDPEQVQGHLNSHKTSLSDESMEKLKMDLCPLSYIKFTDTQPQHHKEVKGVKVQSGWWCGEVGCEVSRTTKESMRDHYKTEHGGSAGARGAEEGKPVQAVFGFKKRCTRVEVLPDLSWGALASQFYLDTYPEEDNLEPLGADSEKEINSLFRVTRWNRYYTELEKGPFKTSKKEYAELTELKGISEEDKELKSLFFSYTEMIRGQLEGCAELPLKWINSKE